MAPLYLSTDGFKEQSKKLKTLLAIQITKLISKN